MIFLFCLTCLLATVSCNGYGVPNMYDPIAQLAPLQPPNSNYYPGSYEGHHGHHNHHSHSHSDSSESDERRNSDKCNKECREIKRSCSDYYGNNDCYKPKIRYLSSQQNCSVAVASCTRGRSQGPVTLENKNGDVLFHGYARDHFLYCNRKERWESKDYRGDKLTLRTLRCIEPRSQYAQPAGPSGPY